MQRREASERRNGQTGVVFVPGCGCVRGYTVATARITLPEVYG